MGSNFFFSRFLKYGFCVGKICFFSWWTQEIHVKPMENLDKIVIFEDFPSNIWTKSGREFKIPGRTFQK